MTSGPDTTRERRAWRALVLIQAAAVALVLFAVLVIWILGKVGDNFGSR